MFDAERLKAIEAFLTEAGAPQAYNLLSIRHHHQLSSAFAKLWEP